jgi:hypothetical protein
MRLNIPSQPVTSNEHELKFVLADQRVPAVLHWLRHVCRPDAKFPQNRVFTIYYDTSARTFMREKLNSDYLKTKVRVRWYLPITPPAAANAWLEIKQKTGAQRRKFRLPLPYAGDLLATLPLEHPLLRGEIPKLLSTHGMSSATDLTPMFLSHYERHRFVEPLQRVNVCVDSSLAITKVNRQLFPGAPFMRSHPAVIEVKGATTRLPATLTQLLQMGCVRTTFSKYYFCYQQLLTPV